MSSNILQFSLNRCTSVENAGPGLLRSTCRLQDTLSHAEVSITVQLPGLEIQSAEGFFAHAYLEPVADLAQRLQRIVGVRVGSGMGKILRGLLGDAESLEQLVYMVEEACDGVILSLTRKILAQAPDDEAGKVAFYSNMVQENVRLYDRCAAFGKGTPLVRGLEAAQREGE
ncbi:MAG: hypothetical protein P1P84_17320 [Deferrisomatales bacterium]|nr:hypothetical protein [Deferrisomatales bacterium]